jgi:hypothetical protein
MWLAQVVSLTSEAPEEHGRIIAVSQQIIELRGLLSANKGHRFGPLSNPRAGIVALLQSCQSTCRSPVFCLVAAMTPRIFRTCHRQFGKGAP